MSQQSRELPTHRRVVAAMRHELRLLLYSPLLYVFVAGFLAILSACIFLVADFYHSDEASIRIMLVFLPWVALVLVPALAMRAFAEEVSDRGMELVMTLPLGTGSVVVAKFLAGVSVLLVALAMTAPFAMTVYYLGEPDTGAIAGGYLGAALLLAAFYAISLLAAAVAREPVASFVVAFATLFLMLLLGWDVLARAMSGYLSAGVLTTLAALSPKNWMDALATGFVDLGNIARFGSTIVAALLATVIALNARRRPPRSGFRVLVGVVLALITLAAWAAGTAAVDRLSAGFDLTQEQEHTLHAGTREMLARLPRGTRVTLYWSEAEATVPAAIKTHARRVRDLLDNFTRQSDGRLHIEAVDPEPDSGEELEALRAGIQRVPMSSGDHFYLGAVLNHAERIGRIVYFDVRRSHLAEYDIAVALNGLTRAQTPKVGILSPLLAPTAAQEDPPGLSFLSELRVAYDLAVIPYFKENLPDDLDVLIVADASVLRRDMLKAIDGFIAGGGSAIIMVDPLVRFSRASNQVTPQASSEINDISDLLLAYGIRYRGEDVVGDEALAAEVADEQQLSLTYPYWVRLRQEQISDAHPVSVALNELFFVEPGAFAIENSARAEALVTTTPASGSLARADFLNATPQQLAAGFRADGNPRVLAVALRGPFTLAFSGAADERKIAEGVVFAIADMDWLFDPFALQTVESGGGSMTRPLNDNITFLLNMVAYASGDATLFSIRSRGRLQRPFTRVENLVKAAQSRYRDQESRLAERVAGTEARIGEIGREAGVSRIEQMPAQLRAAIGQQQLELVTARNELRSIRRNIRKAVDSLGQRLTLLNVVLGPILVVLLFAIARAARNR